MSESDTPRVDMWESEFEFHPDTKWRNSLLHLARQLERELAQAQTRIEELEKAARRVIESEDFDDLEPDDGLWNNSARRFLSAALKEQG